MGYFPEVTPLEHGMHQHKISSEKMVHLAFQGLLIIAEIIACLDDIGRLDYLSCQNDSLWRSEPAEFGANGIVG